MANHAPVKARKTHTSRRIAVGAEVPFFLGLLFFLIFSLGSVIIAQKMTLRYVTREFPRVAEANYRALQANLGLLDQRMSGQLAELRAVCAPPSPAAGLPLAEPAPEANNIP